MIEILHKPFIQWNLIDVAKAYFIPVGLFLLWGLIVCWPKRCKICKHSEEVHAKYSSFHGGGDGPCMNCGKCRIR